MTKTIGSGSQGVHVLGPKPQLVPQSFNDCAKTQKKVPLMKAFVIAASLLAMGASTAGAEEWSREHHPYAREHHGVCREKAERLHRFEHRARADGRITGEERHTIEALKHDLDRTCGGYRWR